MRYNKRQVLRNRREEFKDLFKKRGVQYIKHHETAVLRHPSYDELVRIATINHVWKRGDRLFKLAHKHYGDSQLWWVIGWYNQRPTDSHFGAGDIVEIPVPLDQIMQYLVV